MVRCFDDDFVSADAVHAIEHTVALAIEFAFDAKGGEFVRYYADAPAGLIGGPFIPIRQNFRRGL